MLGFGIGKAGVEVDVLRAYVVAGDVLTLQRAHLGKLVDGRVEMRRRDHEVDDAGVELRALVVDGRAGLGVGAGDVAARVLDQHANLRELGAERAGADGDGQLGLPDHGRALERGHVVRGQRRARTGRPTSRAVRLRVGLGGPCPGRRLRRSESAGAVGAGGRASAAAGGHRED